MKELICVCVCVCVSSHYAPRLRLKSHLNLGFDLESTVI